jgi:hypothetical protein
VSYFQVPLLEIAPEVIKHMNSKEPVKEKIKILGQFHPLINQLLLPSSAGP